MAGGDEVMGRSVGFGYFDIGKGRFVIMGSDRGGGKVVLVVGGVGDDGSEGGGAAGRAEGRVVAFSGLEGAEDVFDVALFNMLP